MLVGFEENHKTGCKYIRVAMRQWFENTKQNVKLDTHSMSFYVYDPWADRYVSQFQTLYDVTARFMDIESCFSNDIFLTKGHITYYFKKVRYYDGQEGKEKTAFQLHKHKMTQPVYMPGRQSGKLPEPEGESVMEGYKIDLGDKDIEHYQITFMKDASPLAIINGDAHVPDNASEF